MSTDVELGMNAAISFVKAVKNQKETNGNFAESKNIAHSFFGYTRVQSLEFRNAFSGALADYILSTMDGAIDIDSWNPAQAMMCSR